ncbi:MAG TPA: hypothetical protein VGF99_08435 [Myxococcota bacterium]
MARVIKGGVGAGAARPATRVLAQADVKKVIEKETYLARQEAEELLKRAEEERREILAEGKQAAARAREEAMTRGASEAFAAAAAEALVAFRRRAERYDEAADDIRILATEIARKLLGGEPDLAAKDIERILANGLAKLRARRKLRVLVATGRRATLSYERPNLIKAVDNEPDLLLEESADVGAGFARVVTEVGGALCGEDEALEALAEAVNVKEIARAAGGAHAVNNETHVGRAPTAPHALATGNGDSAYADDSAEDLPEAQWSADDGDDSELPDASIEDEDADFANGLDDDADEFEVARTPAPLPAPLPRPRVAPQPLPSLPASLTKPAVRAPAPVSTADRAPINGVRAGNRAATRVLAVDDRDALRALARNPQPPPDDDDDLDLFTDARPVRPR